MITETTKAMFEETEDKFARAEMALRETDGTRRSADILPELSENYLRSLTAVLGKEPDRARMILQELVGEVTLAPK